MFGILDLDLPRPLLMASGCSLNLLTTEDHTINFHGIEPHFETEVTYHITIKPQS